MAFASIQATRRHWPAPVMEDAAIMTLRRHALFLSLLLVAPGALATVPTAVPAGLRAAARHFLRQQVRPEGGRVEIQVQRPDPRLQLHPCRVAVKAFLPQGARPRGRTTVGLRCPATPGWTLYLSANIRIFRRIPVLKHALRRGAVIRAGDLRLEETEVSRLPGGYLDRLGDIIGQVALRPLPAGSALTDGALAPPRLIRRGERVTVLAETAGIQVRMAAKALMDGRRGQRIRVKALSSHRVVEGRVTAPGVVKVTL